MYNEMIDTLKMRPTAYMPSPQPLWQDLHISRNMLEAHLNPTAGAATRRHDFVRESVRFIATLRSGGDLLDLGCGPGIYAELFDEAGFSVTGVDFSKRSIEYARASAQENARDITYVEQNYLGISYEEAFDIVTLIYCDFGVLAPDIRLRLLRKIYRALRPGGLLVLDAFTRNAYKDFSEKKTISYEKNGFFSPDEYVCVKRDCRYGTSVILEQYNVITAKALKTYNLWNELFTEERLSHVLHAAGFTGVSFYADVCGKPRCDTDETICAVARK